MQQRRSATRPAVTGGSEQQRQSLLFPGGPPSLPARLPPSLTTLFNERDAGRLLLPWELTAPRCGCQALRDAVLHPGLFRA